MTQEGQALADQDQGDLERDELCVCVDGKSGSVQLTALEERLGGGTHNDDDPL